MGKTGFRLVRKILAGPDRRVTDAEGPGASPLRSAGTSGAAGGAADAAAGQAGYAVCAACHGQNGISVSPPWPTLAGQHEEYLVHALNQYRDGSRKDPVMSPMAAPLTDDDVKILAKYFSSLQGLETTKKAD